MGMTGAVADLGFGCRFVGYGLGSSYICVCCN